MQTKRPAYDFCKRRRVGVKPCLLDADTVHSRGLEGLGNNESGPFIEVSETRCVPPSVAKTCAVLKKT